MSRPNAKASTSPSTPNAPTTCKGSPGARFFQEGPRPQLRFGQIPGNALTVEGLQRKLGPLSLYGSVPSDSGREPSQPYQGISRGLRWLPRCFSADGSTPGRKRKCFDPGPSC